MAKKAKRRTSQRPRPFNPLREITFPFAAVTDEIARDLGEQDGSLLRIERLLVSIRDELRAARSDRRQSRPRKAA